MQDAAIEAHGTDWLAGRSIWDAYAAELDASHKTVETYRHALMRYSAWLDAEGIGPLDATRETIVSFKRHMAETHAASTTNAYLCAVRSLYAWLESRGIHPNVAAGVHGVRTNAHSSKDCLTPEQARRLTAERHSATNELKALRDRAMLNLMTRRGLRTVEVSRADVGDLRQECGRAVLWVQGKGHADKDDFIVLGDECLQPIYDYLRERGPVADDAPLFAATGNRSGGKRMSTRSISRIAKQAMAEQGIESARLTAHSLRHTAVTFALMGGATVQEAQAMARHASVSTTMIYAHNLDRMGAAGERAVDYVMDGGEDTRANTTEHEGEHTGEHMANTHLPAITERVNTRRTQPNRLYVLACEHNRARGEHTREVAHA